MKGPLFARRGDRDGEAGRLGQQVFPEFWRRHPPQADLRPPVVVVYVVGDFGEHLVEGGAFPEVELVLGVAEEALDQGVVPAVPPSTWIGISLGRRGASCIRRRRNGISGRNG